MTGVQTCALPILQTGTLHLVQHEFFDTSIFTSPSLKITFQAELTEQLTDFIPMTLRSYLHYTEME